MISDTNGGIFGEPDQRLARRHPESPSAQAHADAEELLSAAHVHAELLRVHADAARAEAESLRVEAGALRRAAQDEAAAAGARAEALIAQVHAKAEEARAAMEGQAHAARVEVERLTTETTSLRRLVQGEIGAALAATEEMRAEVQSLWADIGKLAAELRLLSGRGPTAPAPEEGKTAATGRQAPAGDLSPAEPASPAPGPVIEPASHTNGRLDELYRAMKVELEQRMADMPPDTDTGREPIAPQLDLIKLLADIWDGASRESTTGLPDRGLPGGPATPRGDESPNGVGHTASTDLPVGGRPERPKASEPLIGSGGWRAGTAPAPPGPPDHGPIDSEAMSSPPDPGRQGRRFRRRG